jgi:hypothetical protein
MQMCAVPLVFRIDVPRLYRLGFLNKFAEAIIIVGEPRINHGWTALFEH